MNNFIRYRWTVLLLGIGVFIPQGGCYSNKEFNRRLEAARSRMNEKRYVLAEQSLTELLRKTTSPAAEVYYLRGLCYQKMEPPKYLEARHDFEKAIKKSRGGLMGARSRAALGNIYFDNHPPDYQQAVEQYLAALPGLDGKPPEDAVLYRLGISLQRLGCWKEADLYFSRCFDRFSESVFADYAKNYFGAGTFRLQLGAFVDLKNAHRQIQQALDLGWSADWAAGEFNGKLLYKVRTGQYDNYDSAQKALAELQQFQDQVIIVPAPLPGLSAQGE